MPVVDIWRGEFGDKYTQRNAVLNTPARIRLWARILGDRCPAEILEVGAGSGANFRALRRICEAWMVGVEPNALARSMLGDVADRAVDGSADDLPAANGSMDLVFTCGVLIHIPFNEQGRACDEIYRVSRRWIACLEYFSPLPEEKQYRGRLGLMFKRDFGSFWMDRYPDLRLLDYGFAWKRVTGLDDLTWWLFEKP